MPQNRPRGPVYRIEHKGPNYKIAPWTSRVLAGLIDYVVPLMLVVFAAWAVWWIFGVILFAVLGFQGWNQWNQGVQGQTVGKMIARTTLVREEDAQPVGPLLAFSRFFLHLLDWIFLAGYIYANWDPKTQTIADKLLQTVVIEETY